MLSLFLLSTVSAFGGTTQKREDDVNPQKLVKPADSNPSFPDRGAALAVPTTPNATPFTMPTNAAELKLLLGKAHATVGKEYALKHDFVATSLADAAAKAALDLETAEEEKQDELALQKQNYEAQIKKLIAVFQAAFPDGNAAIFKALTADSELSSYAASFEAKVSPVEKAAKEKVYNDAVSAYSAKMGSNKDNFAAIKSVVEDNLIDLAALTEGSPDENVVLHKIAITPAVGGKSSERVAKDLAAKRAILKEYKDLEGTPEAQALQKAAAELKAIGGAVTLG